MRVLVISNPLSGGRQKDNFLKNIGNEFTRYGITYEIYETKGVRDEEKIKKAIRDTEPNALLAVGGDGTIGLAAKSII